MVANAPHQVLEVLVEHAVDAAFHHLQRHRGGRWEGAQGGEKKT